MEPVPTPQTANSMPSLQSDDAQRKKIGQRIRSLVGVHFESQRAAAAALGVSKTTLERYFRGESGIDFEFVIRLCRRTGASVDFVANGRAQESNFNTLDKMDNVIFEAAQLILNASRYLGTDHSTEEIAEAIARRACDSLEDTAQQHQLKELTSTQI